MSEELATQEDVSAELAELTAEADRIAAEVKASIDTTQLRVPQLKVAQGNSQETKDGLAEAGDFVNSLTGENFGPRVELVIADTHEGRFWSDDNDMGHSSTSERVDWPDHPCYGELFVECDDAEERYKQAVNEGEKDWGKGPGISTTHNFVGYIVSAEEAPEGSDLPVRLSLMRSNVPAAGKLKQFIKISKAPWDNVYTLETELRSKGRNTWHAVKVTRGRHTDDREKLAAVKLARAARGADEVTYEGEVDAEGSAKPASDERKGGLEV